MRKPFVVGNWKMNTDAKSAIDLAVGVAEKTSANSKVRVGVCPPFVYLAAVAAKLKGSNVELSGQNCYHEAKGAFTGETSPGMLLDIGCAWVILGHSERRHVLGEVDVVIQKKTVAALAAGLKVILCVGELLTEREKSQTEAVVARQLEASLHGLNETQLSNLVIAYEPVWAIGTGKVATPEQAEEVHAFIRQWLTTKFGSGVANAMIIQYGGSVNPGNAAGIMTKPNVDGLLVGGASLKVDDFVAIVNASA